MPTQQLLFGFKGSDGIARKFAKLSVTSDVHGELRDLVLVQYDAANLLHFTLHFRARESLAPEYHMVHEHPETFAAEDRPTGPIVIDRSLPSPDELKGHPWFVQMMPFSIRNDIEAYRRFSPSERQRNEEGITDVADVPFGAFGGGRFEVYLVAPGDSSAVNRRKARLGSALRIQRVCTGVRPWILGEVYLKVLPVGLAERMRRLTDGDIE